MNAETPLVCNMNVFTSDQREKHIQNTIQMIQGIQGIQELNHGYEFTFPDQPEYISRIAEFISNEHLCCPFLEFDLNVSSTRSFISLSLTGPAGTREFLQEEFRGAFQ
jgi:hypothetical protein